LQAEAGIFGADKDGGSSGRGLGPYDPCEIGVCGDELAGDFHLRELECGQPDKDNLTKESRPTGDPLSVEQLPLFPAHSKEQYALGEGPDKGRRVERICGVRGRFGRSCEFRFCGEFLCRERGSNERVDKVHCRV